MTPRAFFYIATTSICPGGCAWRVIKYTLCQPPPFFMTKGSAQQGEWLPGDAEIFYSAEAAMLMAYKWSYFELFQEIMRDHENSTHPLHQKAVQAIRERIDQDRMPRPIDAGHVAGEIVDKHYGKMRFII